MQSKKSPIAGTLVAFLFLFSIVTPALAVSWTDVGDAGNTPVTAQTPLGEGDVPQAAARAVPEPSSFLLLGFGLVGVGFASRRLANRRQ